VLRGRHPKGHAVPAARALDHPRIPPLLAEFLFTVAWQCGRIPPAKAVTFRCFAYMHGVCPEPESEKRNMDGGAPRDAEAEFRSIYERNAIAVFRFALSLGADADEAEDITAEAFARALTSATPIRELTARAYVMTIARHYFLETRRRRRKETGLAASLADHGSPPDAGVEHSSELDALRARLARLSESERAVLLMRTEYEMPYDEIARTLGISVTAAKVKAHRARRALAALIPRAS